LLFSFPAFTALYLIAAYYAGLYDRYYRASNLVRSTFFATLFLLAIYALLPEQIRFSRGIIVFGALFAFILISLMRMILVKSGILFEPVDRISKPYILIAGTEKEFGEVNAFLADKNMSDKVLGRIAVSDDGKQYLSTFDELKTASGLLNAQEIIFHTGTLSYKKIIEQVKELKGSVKLRFFAGSSIVGSDEKTSRGKILSAETEYRLARPASLRLKRLLDVIIAFIGLISFPIQIFLVKQPINFFRNCFQILGGKKTWVGYELYSSQLQKLRKGVLGTTGNKKEKAQLGTESLHQVDYWYAHNYEAFQDLKIIFGNYRYLGS
jgi:hypothetical protein